MTVYVFASYTPKTWLVRAESPEAAKGKMWDENQSETSSIEYLGPLNEVMEDGDVVTPMPE